MTNLPDVIYFDPSVEHKTVFHAIRERCPGVPVIPAEKDILKSERAFEDAKRQLYLTTYKGTFIKPCQGTRSYLCCGYYTLNLSTGCRLDCSYCILQHYIRNNPVTTYYLNWDDIVKSVAAAAKRRSRTVLRLGSGELCDSLDYDEITGFSSFMNEVLPEYPKILFEYKTKTVNIGGLLKGDARNVVCSWSLNTDRVIEREEHGAASLTERLEAAGRCADKGYLIGFHFDPILNYPGHLEEYGAVVERIRDYVPPSSIAWMSMGYFRYFQSMKHAIYARFSGTNLFTAEYYRCPDGKMRCVRQERAAGYRHMLKRIREVLPGVFVYMCMESPAVWHEVFGIKNMSTAKLVRMFNERAEDCLRSRNVI